MFINDIRHDFYRLLIGNRILLLVNYDVDAICACKILQQILRTDNIVYTLVPIRGIEDLKRAYRENCDKVKYVLLINCGGTLDVIELLEPENDVVFFILDSHRPTDVCNIYDSHQVRLLAEPDDEEKVPDAKDIFRDESSEEEDANNSDEDSGDEADRQNKRRRLAEEAIVKRRERRQWEENRNHIMFQYTQYSYYGRSSAVLVFELAWKLSKDTKDLLWWAVVGATEQMLLSKVEYQQYVLETGNLQNHAQRLSHKDGDDEDSCTALKIVYNKDLQLALYRHWTVESSLRYSRYSATKLRLWTLRGEKKVHELLAEMGLPLVQSRQKFGAMDLVLRQEFHAKMEKLGEKYNLDRIVYASFSLQYGYRGRFCALDIVYAMLALLECPTRDKLPADCFMEALDCVSRLKKEVLEEGIEMAKKVLICIFKQVQTLLDMRQVISAGPFVYLVLQEGTLDVRIFSHPHCLTLLAQFALGAYVAAARSKKAPSQPLIASAPLDTTEGTCLVVGIPPVADESTNNFFGKAFEQAAEKINARINMDYFDTSVAQLKTEDRAKFFDALTSLLS